MRLLFAEDNPADVRLVREMLADAPPGAFELVLADRLETALARLSTGTFDEVLLDLGLPDSQGRQTLAKVLAAGHSLPVVVLTGLEDERFAEEVVRAGAQDYLVKGRFDGELLIRTIRYAAERKRAAARLEQANRDLQNLVEERQRAQDALRNSLDRLRGFIDANIVGVVVATADGTVKEANDYYLRTIGFTREEFAAGKVNWRTLTPPEWLGADEKALRELRETGRCSPYEKEYRRRDGSRVPVFLVDAMLAGPEQEIAAFALDLTEQKRAEEKIRRLHAELERRVDERTAQLKESMTELEAFSYSVSHDLRAPLRSIDGIARALSQPKVGRDESERDRLLGLIRGETNRMGQLIDDMLAFSRVGRQRLEAGVVDMTDLARGVFQELTENRAEPPLDFDVAPLPPAFGDRAMLRQVFTNLLGNAIKFSRGVMRPRIVISGGPHGEQSAYCVTDNGVGFDPRYIDRLFNVFQRLHSEAEFEGTGVGLAIVKRIVDRHGGRVWANGSPGAGAAFHFTLPTPPESRPPEPGSSPPKPNHACALPATP